VKLSVIIPVFNEQDTILEILGRVLAVDAPKEVIVVDDGSTDGTRDRLRRFNHPDVRIVFEPRNRGKGWAVRRGIELSTGDAVIIQDADLEYDPADYAVLLNAMRDEGASVAYGNRLHPGNRESSHLRYLLGGMFLTVVTNVLYGAGIHDEPTCYKLFRGDLLRSLDLRCTRFEFCPEVTAIVRRLGHRIVERPIRYHPRRMEQGKKIRWYDGLHALWTLVRCRFLPAHCLCKGGQSSCHSRCGGQK
jgi:glycosyltransferase involved in cell wall biosynthesis